MAEDENLFFVLVVVLIIVVGAMMYTFYIGRTPETFTEVWLEESFTNARPGEQRQFSFVINNREGKAVAYSYKVSIDDLLLKEGSVELAADTNGIVHESVLFGVASPGKRRVLVEVTKPGRPEPYSLWFWVDVMGA